MQRRCPLLDSDMQNVRNSFMNSEIEVKVVLHRQAAEAGDAPAMAHLGHMYMNGVGVEASNATALEWFRQAAERNHPSALFGLGYMHLSGFGVPKDAKKAFKYFTAAAEQVRTCPHTHALHHAVAGLAAVPRCSLYFLVDRNLCSSSR